jgi:hypothetical protein
MSTPDSADLAMWRYGIISILLHRNEDDETLEEVLIRLSSQQYRKPDGRFVLYSPETLRKWFYRYRIKAGRKILPAFLLLLNVPVLNLEIFNGLKLKNLHP